MTSPPARARSSTACFEVVAIGASAGGVRALTQLLAALPPTFSAALLIAQHLDPQRKSVLAPLLERRCPLRVREAEDGELLMGGIAYVSPPDRHLTVDHGRVSLTRAPAVNLSRPSVDVLFESVAHEYGKGAIGVILSGSGIDGARGLEAIKRGGGVTIVQDPSGADHARMPRTAVLTGCVDVILPLDAIGAAIARLVLEGGRSPS